jgi:hypothetical protein
MTKAPRELGYEVSVRDPAIKPDDPGYVFPETSSLLTSAEAAHMALSDMADNKSSILMGASFVVFGLSIGDIASGKAGLPILLLTLFSFAATVLGVLTVRPGRLKPFKVTPDKANLMFFGSFTNISRQEYEDQVIKTLISEEETYRQMARSIYDHGCVLKREKFQWLYWSYTLFLVGLIVTFAAVVVEVLLNR